MAAKQLHCGLQGRSGSTEGREQAKRSTACVHAASSTNQTLACSRSHSVQGRVLGPGRAGQVQSTHMQGGAQPGPVALALGRGGATPPCRRAAGQGMAPLDRRVWGRRECCHTGCTVWGEGPDPPPSQLAQPQAWRMRGGVACSLHPPQAHRGNRFGVRARGAAQRAQGVAWRHCGPGADIPREGGQHPPPSTPSGQGGGGGAARCSPAAQP